MAKKPKKERNPYAKQLSDPKFKKKVVPDKHKDTKEKEIEASFKLTLD